MKSKQPVKPHFPSLPSGRPYWPEEFEPLVVPDLDEIDEVRDTFRPGRIWEEE